MYGEDNASEISGIEWGTVTLGVTKNTQISVLNTGDKPIILYLSANNWTTGVNGTITWNYNDEATDCGEGNGVREGNSLLLGATGKKLPEGFGIGLLLGSIV